MFKIPKSASRALELLSAHGFKAYLVGGCVRDLVMGIPPMDWDIATDATPFETEMVFNDFRIIKTGLKHGTINVIIDGEPLEITTFRIDGAYSDNRRPDSVRFAKTLRDDLARRDFTINALAYSPNSGLIDYYNGTGDIKSGIIRCVGEPDKRFREDALRILRGLRFASVLSFYIDHATASSIHRNKDLLLNISSERIRAELTKMLCGKNVADVLLSYSDVISVPIPEITPMIGFEQHNRHHIFDVWHHTVSVIENISADPVLRWAALFHDIGKPRCFSMDENGEGHFYGHAFVSRDMANMIMDRLKFNNESREMISLLISHHIMEIPAREKPVKRYISKFGIDALFKLVELFRADNLAKAKEFQSKQDEYGALEAIIEKILCDSPCLSLKDLAVNGNDLISLGYRGKQIGDALSLLLSAVIDEAVQNDRQALLDYLKNDN